MLWFRFVLFLMISDIEIHLLTLYLSLRENVYPSPLPIFNWIICFLFAELYEFFNLDMNSLLGT